MNNPADDITRLEELANEAHTPARAAEADALLANLPPDQQAHWRARMAEAEILHNALAEIPVPENFMTRLLAGPDAATTMIANGHHIKIVPKPAPSRAARIWAYAASFLIIIGVVTGIIISNRPPTARGAIPKEIVAAVASAAIQLHQNPPEMLIASSDPAAVEAALKGKSLSFPVAVLAPRKKMELLGGGVCSLGSGQAAFTRWRDGTITYTLYQFDAATWKIPADFDPVVSPTASQDDPRISMWPGQENVCAWALVMESSKAGNYFSY